jgi:DNA repair protein RadC
MESRYTPIQRIKIVKEGTVPYAKKITSTVEAREFCLLIAQERASDREEFITIALDTKHKPLHIEVTTIGVLDASLVHPREVFKMAIVAGAAAVLLMHNHPSGDPTPSREDHAVTERLTEAGKMLGITVLDHIIVGDDTTLSMREL